MKVHHRERAAGCDQRLLSFLDWLEIHGPFEVTIPQKGGLRLDEVEQAELFAQHLSDAETLEKTPHGRGGALDIAPLINGAVPWKRFDLFKTLGVLAEAHGLEWGGRWPKPDSDHVQVKDWKSLPFPPKAA